MFRVIVKSPPEYLKMVNKAYAEMYSCTLFEAMQKKGTGLSGNAESSALYYTLGRKLLKSGLPKITIAAELIKKACAGYGTNKLLLTTTLILFQNNMRQVNEDHMTEFYETIHQRIRRECSGKYKTLLLAVVNKECLAECY